MRHIRRSVHSASVLRRPVVVAVVARARVRALTARLRRVWHYMRRSGTAPNSAHFRTLMRAYVRNHSLRWLRCDPQQAEALRRACVTLDGRPLPFIAGVDEPASVAPVTAIDKQADALVAATLRPGGAGARPRRRIVEGFVSAGYSASVGEGVERGFGKPLQDTISPEARRALESLHIRLAGAASDTTVQAAEREPAPSFDNGELPVSTLRQLCLWRLEEMRAAGLSVAAADLNCVVQLSANSGQSSTVLDDIGLFAGTDADAVSLFGRFGVQPDHVSYSLALEACARSGDLETGRKVWGVLRCRQQDPLRRHYIWYVHLLAKCNVLEEAVDLVEAMCRRHASLRQLRPSAAAGPPAVQRASAAIAPTLGMQPRLGQTWVPVPAELSVRSSARRLGRVPAPPCAESTLRQILYARCRDRVDGDLLWRRAERACKEALAGDPRRPSGLPEQPRAGGPSPGGRSRRMMPVPAKMRRQRRHKPRWQH